MFGLLRKRPGPDPVIGFHERIVAASRRPVLYGQGGFPDTTEGRFEALVLHVLAVLRRLRDLPPPAGDVAQDLVDAVFAHLEVALRELGVGDFGVPKRMKKLGQAFYDRTAKYDPVLDGKDPAALASMISDRLGGDAGLYREAALSILVLEAALSGADLDAVMREPGGVGKADA